MKYLHVHEWSELQHYKRRCPPWIKLHKNWLDNLKFMQLSDESKALLMLLWLIASEHEGKIPYDHEDLCFRLRKQSINLKPLIDAGFLTHASDSLADASPTQADAVPETEGEAKKETETKPESEAKTDEAPATTIDGNSSDLEVNPSPQTLRSAATPTDSVGIKIPEWKRDGSECTRNDLTPAPSPNPSEKIQTPSDPTIPIIDSALKGEEWGGQDARRVVWLLNYYFKRVTEVDMKNLEYQFSSMRKLCTEHDPEWVMGAWQRYLKEQDGKFLSWSNFAERPGVWKPKKQYRPRMAIDILREEDEKRKRLGDKYALAQS